MYDLLALKKYILILFLKYLKIVSIWQIYEAVTRQLYYSLRSEGPQIYVILVWSLKIQ